MSARRKTRILAFQALYAWDASNVPYDQLLSFSWLEDEKLAKMDEESRTFARLLIAGTIENLSTVDAAISRHLQHWSFDRLKRVDVALLRMTVYAILFQPEIPARISIDEAIEIAKEYGSDESFRFVNGVLDAVLKERGNIDS